MLTRRTVLQLAGLSAGATALGACAARPGTDSPRPTRGDLLFAATTTGLVAIDAVTGKSALPGPAALATADWTRVVTAQPDVKGTRFAAEDPATGQVLIGGTVRDALEPRVVSTDGRLIALATPTGAGADPYRPAGRSRTTIVVVDGAGERARLDLPGNLEPEAFSSDGRLLYVLDYLPPEKPDRYRVRAVDLASRTLSALWTRDKKPIPPGAEESMRGEGRQAVYDRSRKILFTLYTHQPDHQHTRDLIGARADKPDVHAFVHSLNLEQGWAFCIDLPGPFGEADAAGHTIALAPSGTELYVASAASGVLARIDPEALTVNGVARFTGTDGVAASAATKTGELVLGAGRQLLVQPVGGGAATASWRTNAPVRGLALCGTRVYVGQDGAVVAFDVASGAEVARVAVPGLVAVRHAVER
jgi:hypothetical protein